MKRVLSIALSLLLAEIAVGQPRELLLERQFSAAFYNVENLYDTLRSSFYDDSAFTPSGRNRWTSERYVAKLGALGRVLDDLDADFVGLAEVENRQTVCDLASVLKEDYCLVHRTSSDRRGIDVALLYKADRFEPLEVQQIGVGSSREVLRVGALWWGERFDILVWHAPSKLNRRSYRSEALQALRLVADSLVGCGRQVVVMGDMNADSREDEFVSAFGDGAYALPVDDGVQFGGSYFGDGRWQLFDRIIVDAATANVCAPLRGGVFVRRYMLSTRSAGTENGSEGIPKRTYEGRNYVGGASDHLPVFVFWRQ